MARSRRTSFAIGALALLIVAGCAPAQVPAGTAQRNLETSRTTAKVAPPPKPEASAAATTSGAGGAAASARPIEVTPPKLPSQARAIWAAVPVDHTEIQGLAALDDGGVLVAGHDWQVSSRKDMFTERLDREGRSVWRRFAMGRFVRGVAARGGHAFVLTEFSGRFEWDSSKLRAVGNTDVFVGRLADDGALRWGKLFGAPGFDRAHDVAVTSDGGAVVAQSHFGAAQVGEVRIEPFGGEDAVVAKWSADGVLEWATGFAWRGSDSAAAIASDAAGRVIVGGTRYETASTWASAQQESPSHGWIATLDAHGAVRWVTSLGGPRGHSGVRDVVVAPSGEIVVTGAFVGTAHVGSTELSAPRGGRFVAGLDADGNIQWARSVPEFSCLTVDAEGHRIAVGPRGVFAIGDAVTWLSQWDPEVVWSVNACASGADRTLYVAGLAGSAKVSVAGLPLPAPSEQRYRMSNSPAFVVALAY